MLLGMRKGGVVEKGGKKGEERHRMRRSWMSWFWGCLQYALSRAFIAQARSFWISSAVRVCGEDMVAVRYGCLMRLLVHESMVQERNLR